MTNFRIIAAVLLSLSPAAFSQSPIESGARASDKDGVRPNLTGSVVDSEKRPVAGATVAIYTAGPKVGTSTYCPSCYPDCAKTATTDSAGKFTIRSLDPTLRFRVLIVANGHTPEFVARVDPAGGPVDAVLKPTDPGRLKAGHVVRGRVLDPEGSPVFGASVSSFGKKVGNGARYGSLPGIDALAVTNKNGEFAITSGEANISLVLRVEARGYLAMISPFLAAGDQVHVLDMHYGVTVRGRVVKDAQPVSGVGIGIDQVNRMGLTYLGHQEIATAKDGRFEIRNVGPDDDHYVYGLIESLKPLGAIASKKFRAGADRTDLDVGDLEVRPGFKLAGRVLLADGKSIPPNTRFGLSRHDAWDGQSVDLGKDGEFSFVGLPPAKYSVHVAVKGYRFSRKNESLDTLNFDGLVGRVDADISNLRVLLEPGEQEQYDSQKGSTREEYEARVRIAKLPIRGISD